MSKNTKTEQCTVTMPTVIYVACCQLVNEHTGLLSYESKMLQIVQMFMEWCDH